MISKDFFNKGYCIIDDFLDNDVSNIILQKFQKNKNWFRVDQKREHYKTDGPFEMESKYFPDHDEIYIQTSWRAKSLENSVEWKDIFKKYFIEYLEQYFSNKVLCETTYIIKSMENDFSRVHTDDLRGEVDRVDIGLLYYVCDDWKWDWGGILMIGENTKTDKMEAIIPKNNRLVLINNQRRCPHWITPVAKYAKYNRYAVASFIGCKESVDKDIT